MSKKVLVIAAHPDDEVLGPGGTVARHVSRGDQVTIALVADSDSVRYDEDTIRAIRGCAQEAAKQLGVSDVYFAGLPDQKLDSLPILTVIQWIEQVLGDTQPQVVYTHHRGDINRDHQVVQEATLTAARPYSAPYVERILSYETPSATEWNGPYADKTFAPNYFVNISAYLEQKISAMSAYTTEVLKAPHPRSLESLRARAAYWGSVVGVTAAEPFVILREIERSER